MSEPSRTDAASADLDAVRSAFGDFRDALSSMQADLPSHLRPPVAFDADYLNRPGAEQLRAFWSLTSGQEDRTPWLAAGALILGPLESETERQGWLEQMTSGEGIDAVANPDWDSSDSLDPDAVRTVYFAAGWIPWLHDGEGNYLAVDLVPLPNGRPGQIILCGRDEDEKCVVAPDLATVLRTLATECRDGRWTLITEPSADPSRLPFQYIKRRDGRFMTACKER